MCSPDEILQAWGRGMGGGHLGCCEGGQRQMVVVSQNALSSGQARSLRPSEGAFLWIWNDPLVSSMNMSTCWVEVTPEPLLPKE